MDNLSGTEKICPEREIEKRKTVNWGQGNDTGNQKTREQTVGHSGTGKGRGKGQKWGIHTRLRPGEM